MHIRISGGPQRQSIYWDGVKLTKQEIINALAEPGIAIEAESKSNRNIDIIVIPDEVDDASKTSQRDDQTIPVVHWTEFIHEHLTSKQLTKLHKLLLHGNSKKSSSSRSSRHSASSASSSSASVKKTSGKRGGGNKKGQPTRTFQEAYDIMFPDDKGKELSRVMWGRHKGAALRSMSKEELLTDPKFSSEFVSRKMTQSSSSESLVKVALQTMR